MGSRSLDYDHGSLTVVKDSVVEQGRLSDVLRIWRRRAEGKAQNVFQGALAAELGLRGYWPYGEAVGTGRHSGNDDCGGG